MRLTWALPEDLVAHELVQAADEGCTVDDVAEAWAAAGGQVVPPTGGTSDVADSAGLRGLARELLDELDRRTAARRAAVPSGPDADEPDDLDHISAQWTDLVSLPDLPAVDGVDGGALFDRVHGGWLGRCAGCLLGKPVEKIPREGIEAIARATGNWPIRGYFTALGLPAAVADRWPWNRRSRGTSLVENIDGMPEDDDLNYSMLALALVERHGDRLTTDDVAQAWLDSLPAGRVFTAERAAYRNLLDGVPVEQAAQVHNPFREWIGALIRADVHGWVHPGRPGDAARLAYRDAVLSHRRNGVYGAMFVAAMSAAALVCDDVDAVVEHGLSVVPPRSRLARAVRFGVEVGRSGVPLAEALDALHGAYGHLHWVHVLNNTALVAYALTASRGEFGPAVAAAVAGGWDTDSGAATVGAVCGALAGAAALPAAWVAPLRNRIASSLPGFDGAAPDALARRTVEVARGG